jgi:hypothetical protein
MNIHPFIKRYGIFGLIAAICTILGFIFPDQSKRFFSLVSISINDQPLVFIQIILTIIISVLIYVTICLMNENKKEKQEISTLLESFTTLANEHHSNDKSVKQEMDNFLEINKGCNKIKDYFVTTITYGINSIKPKDAYSHDFFKELYSRTNKELVISGHSLNNTINMQRRSDVRIAFKKAILRIIENKGIVKILLKTVGPDNPKSKRDNFIKFIKEVQTEITKKNPNIDLEEIMNTYLLIKEVSYIGYYVVQNEDISLIGHYKISEDKNIYTIDVNRDIGYGNCYINDFELVFNEKANLISIQ